jgi:hypothetical protein
VGPGPIGPDHPPDERATVGGMFARYFVELPIPASEAVRALARDPNVWLPGLAERANRRGESLLADVGFGSRGRIHKTVEVEVGEPVVANGATAIPIRWSASGPGGILPALDADLEVAPLGAEGSQLAISARYVPPFGGLGRLIDRAMLARVAESTIKCFLDRVAEAVLAEIHRSDGDEGERATPTSPLRSSS